MSALNARKAQFGTAIRSGKASEGLNTRWTAANERDLEERLSWRGEGYYNSSANRFTTRKLPNVFEGATLIRRLDSYNHIPKHTIVCCMDNLVRIYAR
ncbi:hypothetical protein AGABI1DRAFT_86385 [Agaricus bisporus var. burnettii JB137-S8]|uniref:Uncharacterized protein n=1 Tax=Agaricus bisporus var. burnettii (strain JB137-S8 / ATCC MYA-4627 / FGSC 10392) TaxID=597362 RepID=K5WQX7_AGABU|nr:uncharacterized protein AGABI1DRAFT_86385 [Agaricus bisporus var. burnettii JB137-S8]EKM77761.1 hypothetical protein AGABI1DRAFT_86385 [Agaricus bisporus var. burnettii JB137-S8]